MLIEAIEKAARERDEYLAGFGCTDGNCIISKPKWAHTNGGCQCWRFRDRVTRLAFAHQRFAKKVQEAASNACDEQDLSQYTVVAGDTLSEIAVRFGTTVGCLRRLNRIRDPDVIYVGDTLTLPLKTRVIGDPVEAESRA